MKQIYYTEEGKPYVLRLVTKNLVGQVVPNSTNIVPRVLVNLPSSLDIGAVALTTSRRIIPVHLNFALFNIAATVSTVNISSVYYNARVGVVPVNTYAQQSCQAKLFPLISREFYDTDFDYVYSVRYGQAVFVDGDFLDTTSGIQFTFFPSISRALIFQPNMLIVPAGTYNVSLTFLYFELL